MSSADASRLTALVQESQKANDEDEDAVFGAPSAATYESHSGGIIGTMEGLLSKAQEQLDTARQHEMTSAHNYEILRQSLADEIKYGKEDWLDTQKCVSEAQQSKAVAEGDLSVTSKDLAENDKALKALHHNCMSKATEFEENTKSRDEELKGLAQARAIIAKSTGGAGGAEEQTYGLAQVSFLQFSQNGQAQLVSGADLANFEAVRFIRDLARKQNSPELMQLASRMASAIRMGAGIGDDPFGKVKGLIEELIVRLEKAAAAEAAHKEYCDKEFAETYASKDTKEALVSKFTSKIDGAKARSAQLKDEVAGLSAQLSALHKTQMEMDAIRAEEKAAFDKNKPEMEEGLAGVKLALKVLRDYYGKEGKDHEAAEGASTGVIGLIEVIESDFSKALSQMTADEEAAVADHTAQTNENEVVKTMKEQDVEYKTKEATSLDKAVAELSSDLASVHEELAAIMEYLEKLKEMCIAKPETYEERKARREREIAGLKEALNILEGEAVLIQSSARTAKSLRKVRA